MNPFDPNFVGQLAEPTRRERGHAKAARTMSQRMQAVLDRDGPATAVTRQQREQAALKTAQIKKVGAF